ACRNKTAPWSLSTRCTFSRADRFGQDETALGLSMPVPVRRAHAKGPSYKRIIAPAPKFDQAQAVAKRIGEKREQAKRLLAHFALGRSSIRDRTRACCVNVVHLKVHVHGGPVARIGAARARPCEGFASLGLRQQIDGYPRTQKLHSDCS